MIRDTGVNNDSAEMKETNATALLYKPSHHVKNGGVRILVGERIEHLTRYFLVAAHVIRLGERAKITWYQRSHIRDIDHRTLDAFIIGRPL